MGSFFSTTTSCLFARGESRSRAKHGYQLLSAKVRKSEPCAQKGWGGLFLFAAREAPPGQERLFCAIAACVDDARRMVRSSIAALFADETQSYMRLSESKALALSGD